MIDEDKKKLSEKPFLIFLLTFSILAVLLVILAAFDEKDLSLVIGTYFLYGGMITAIIGFAFLNKGNNTFMGTSKYIKDNEYFKKVRAYERPFERVVWAVILGAISIAAIGYFLNRVLVG